MTLSWNAGQSRGGERRGTRHFASYDSYRMLERQTVGIDILLQGGFMHEAPDGKMKETDCAITPANKDLNPVVSKHSIPACAGMTTYSCL